MRLALAAAFAGTALAATQAQEFPNRSITIVVGLAAGGVTDVTTRQYAEVVSKNIGQAIVIENRPVAGGAVAAAAVQNAQPDGYTILMVVGSQFASLPAMGATGYDPLKGFAPITLLFRLPTLVVVPFDSPAKSMAELLALGKSKPGGILLGSPGAGSPGHLLAARISMGTDTPMQYVQYRGGAPVMADLVAGRVDFSLASNNSARAHIDAKKLRPLAVDAGARLPAMPDVPTLTEVGLAQYKVETGAACRRPRHSQGHCCEVELGIRQRRAKPRIDQSADRERQPDRQQFPRGDEQDRDRGSEKHGAADHGARAQGQMISRPALW